jgi:hypothetical protein
MSEYGKAAVMAVRYCQSGKADDPKAAWVAAVLVVFPTSESQRNKGCPRGAFLGLCEEGLIEGIPPGKYTRSKLNKHYAVRAVRLIRANPALAGDAKKLWRRVVNRKTFRPNGQMDVALALWNACLVLRRRDGDL